MHLRSIVIFTLFAAISLTMNQFTSDVAVNYGSVVRIINPFNGYMYDKHNIEYTHMISSSVEAGLCLSLDSESMILGLSGSLVKSIRLLQKHMRILYSVGTASLFLAQ